jgi:hypothetical protein
MPHTSITSGGSSYVACSLDDLAPSETPLIDWQNERANSSHVHSNGVYKDAPVDFVRPQSVAAVFWLI